MTHSPLGCSGQYWLAYVDDCSCFNNLLKNQENNKNSKIYSAKDFGQYFKDLKHNKRADRLEKHAKIISQLNKINDLVNMDLSLIEEKIVSNALSGKKKIVFNANIYRCTIDEFNIALDSLKNKMSLLGLEV